jgi:hypothetical protein
MLLEAHPAVQMRSISILRRKIECAAARREAIDADPREAAEAADSFRALFESTFRAKVERVSISRSVKDIDAWRSAFAGWTSYRATDGSASVLVAMPGNVVLAAAQAALGRGREPEAGEVNALDRRLAGVFANCIAKLSVERHFNGAPAPGLNIASVAATAGELALNRDHARLAVSSISARFAGDEEAFEVAAAFPAADAPAVLPDAAHHDRWSSGLRRAVEAARATCRAVIARERLPSEVLLGLRPGDVIPLPAASLTNVRLEAQNGLAVARGRLGDLHGKRAVQAEE